MKQLKTLLLIVAILFSVPVLAVVKNTASTSKVMTNYIYTYTTMVNTHHHGPNGSYELYTVNTYGVGILGQVTLISSVVYPVSPVGY